MLFSTSVIVACTTEGGGSEPTGTRSCDDLATCNEDDASDGKNGPDAGGGDGAVSNGPVNSEQEKQSDRTRERAASTVDVRRDSLVTG